LTGTLNLPACNASASNRQKPPADFRQFEAAMKLLKAPTETAAITVDPGGLAGLEQSTPDMDFMLDNGKKIKVGTRALMPFIIMQGAGSYVIKKREGYEGRGGDRRSEAQDAPMKSKPSWKEFCPATFDGASHDSVDRTIKVWRIAERRAFAEYGEHSPEYRILTTPPWLLNAEDLEVMADALEKLIPEKNQNELLITIRSANAPHTLTASDRKKAAAAATESKKARKNSTITPEKARIFMDDFIHSLTSFETECGRLTLPEDSKDPRFNDFKNSLLVLPLRKDCEPDQTALMDYRDEFEILKTALEADLAKILTAFDEFIAAKMEGDAATAADVSKRSRKSSKTSKK
jgi:hypothetical protein